ncbi:Methyltransferase domain-containing protein [Oceanospirillum multiglobuliferum]|uniref:Methyltransferase domain-containing protein n=1 Tax=Oceanospirillum multiglobuliferum TaxID=64969 RepID=A0A1T4NS60_9GAMM|nr:methyltransferase [Oceanospirillum multiglobuliferum]OPX55688.1 hypothetical protein BTE48_07270 [Oceanospirillum multiglobuliferum]SJZ82034.1 Methyltransferase domain-containing protein [Oceanospirillum multiglobuliferum]
MSVLLDRFQQIDDLLWQYQHYWQLQPFHHRHIGWKIQHPELTEALLALGDDALQAFYQQPITQLAEWLSPWLPDAPNLVSLTELTVQPLLAQTENSEEKRLSQGIPGRKWQQIQQFAQQVPKTDTLLEWCAGKGHLGRLLAFQGKGKVQSLEWQAQLCEQGQQQADHWQLPQRLIHGDAFSDDAAHLLQHNQCAVALHACGDLHNTLIQHSVHSNIESLLISPCCYHLTQDEPYQALSKAAQHSALQLSKQDLKLPLQETVTGGNRISKLRDTELHWRMAFDELQRILLQSNQYMPLPTLPKKLLTGDFSEFTTWALHNRKINQVVDKAKLEQALQAGAIRVKQVRRMELVQHIFRRPLELWLVLDRALVLEEAGFHVELSTFCDKQLSPRNILIKARR